MALTPGRRLGAYEVIGSLGAGGMGEVYRARDTRLGRTVALKILPDLFGSDPERLARFQREAEILASLNHPNIAAIYGLEDRALVLELVEGPTLADRISQGPLPLDEALGLARQIADALEAAHGQGVIHRDLKPANIKLRPDGTVKVLDFGLAKAADAGAADGVGPSHHATTMAHSPTMMSPAYTQMGVILGTAAYMAPEQARGRTVDKRADIWAFGCVLYEMVSGRRAFAGEDVTDTLASVVKEQVDLDLAPPPLRRLLKKCLEKDPKQRLRDIGDAWELIESPSAAAPVPADAPPRAASRVSWGVAGLLALGLAALGVVHFREVPPVAVTTRFAQPWPASETGATGSSHFFVVSPDGRYLAIVAENALWVRAFDSLDLVRLDRTDGATYPFWSPDSATIGFFSGGQLRTIPRGGGAVRVICEAAGGRGGAWSPRGEIVFSAGFGQTGLSRVPQEGGTPTAATTLVSQGPSDAHRYPDFLPDGNHFSFLFLTSSRDAAGVYVGSLDGAPPVRVLEGTDNALYARGVESAARGHLLYRRQDAVMAQAFDAGSLTLSGTPVAVATGVGQGENTGLGAFSVGGLGVLAYASETDSSREIVRLSRAGTREATLTPLLRIGSFAVSPDERRLAVSLEGATMGSWSSDLWLQSIEAGAPSRFTFGPEPGWMFPAWSPASDQIAYASLDLAGLAGYEIRRKPASMAGVDELLLRSGDTLTLWDWSPDGRTLVYSDQVDLQLLPLEGERKPQVFAKTPGEDLYAQFSPDGKWMAYSSGARGQAEVFVQPVPATGPLWQISRGGGTMPRWRRDGRELYYRASDGRLMAVAVSATGAAFEPRATHEALFAVPEMGNTDRFTYQPAADGQRFYVNVPVAGTSPPISVVLNWPLALKR